MSLRNDMQQNIQIELNFSSLPAGETCEAGREEPESFPTVNAPESPASTNRLMEEVCERENLKEALRRVKSNKGSPGIDGMTVNELPAYLVEYWPAIREQLLSGTYKPKPVKRVEIPKPDGGVRKLGIPTVLVDSFSRQFEFSNGNGTQRFLNTATGSDLDGRPIKRWQRRSSILPKAEAGALTSIWKNSSIGSITTN